MKKVPPGYTAEELDRDNPHNAWMYENRDTCEDQEEPIEDSGYCIACSGSGEGQYEGTRCHVCNGRGETP